ncbi:NAD(P)/FAD-dependent oxidoreductase [Actinospica robiniae]|uniref:NAD(P)/FAD-dependent oxidoreductase n=1 Tax=Actinospica robiniae TaxID=304901 RepID=UPI000421D9D4|nr:FAD-dependent monooxygenase [Actinospica robiniae]
MTRALVLGGGFAGVLFALALAEHVDEVALVEGATYRGAGERNGLPQAHHNHVLVSGGARALDQLLPGCVQDVLAHGAHHRGLSEGTLILHADGWFRRQPSEAGLLSCSRWQLDHLIRRRTLASGTIRLLTGTRALGLSGDARRVDGVVVRRPNGGVETLAADLVVDATGRRSKAAAWLAEIGGPAVDEEKVDSGLAYATRFYRAPEDLASRIPAIMLHPPATSGPARGATLFPIEGGRWIVTLTGTHGGHPPVDEAGFAAFARDLRSGVVAELMACAVPLGPVRPYRNTWNRRRYFERTSMPGGLLVVGDALVAVNPVHSHGMSVAAISALRMRERLSRDGPSPALFPELQAVIAAEAERSWRMATDVDRARIGGSSTRDERTEYQRRVQESAARKRLNGRALMSELFRAQALLPPDPTSGRERFRELTEGSDRLLTEDEAIGQYPGLAEWWAARAGRRELRSAA